MSTESQRAPRSKRFWLAAAAVSVVVFAALLVAATTRSTSPPPSADGSRSVRFAGSAADGSGQVGERLGGFSLVSIDGEQVNAPADTPGVVFFMAGWCGSCLPEAAALEQIRDRFGDRVSVLAVSSDPTDSEAALREFRVAAGDAGYSFAWDREGALARRLAVSALDTTLVYDAGGKVVFRDAGPTDAATLLAALRKAGLA